MIALLKEKYGCIIKTVICLAAFAATLFAVYLVICKLIDEKTGY